MRVIFETDKLTVSVSQGSREDIWVTFGYFGWNEPFGIGYLSSIGQAGVYLVAKPNHWFQHEEIHDALEAIRSEIADVQGRRVFYGSSMGAFAAVAFSGPLAASHVIAAAPQVSISRTIVGHFDNRWTDIGDQVRFEYEDARTSMSSSARVCVIYDNLHPADKKHAELLAEAPNVELYAFPAAGHSVLGTLQTAGILKDALKILLDSSTHAIAGMQEIRSRYRSARSGLSLYYYAVGEYYHDKGNGLKSIYFYSIACQSQPLFHESLTRLADDFKALQLKMGRAWVEGLVISEDLVAAVTAGVAKGSVPIGECVRIAHDLVGYGRRSMAARLSEATLQCWPNHPAALRLASWLKRLEAQELIAQSLEFARMSNTGEERDLGWEIDQIYSLILLNQPERAKALFENVCLQYPSDIRLETFLQAFPSARFLRQ